MSCQYQKIFEGQGGQNTGLRVGRDGLSLWPLSVLILGPWTSHLNLGFCSYKRGQTRGLALSILSGSEIKQDPGKGFVKF